ncbi:hypothetical protein BS78_02G140000 [Paspalum vaginatum]|nr:hypothetical protein BS78_02G140000 [Paspalum vaginatum]
MDAGAGHLKLFNGKAYLQSKKPSLGLASAASCRRRRRGCGERGLRQAWPSVGRWSAWPWAGVALCRRQRGVTSPASCRCRRRQARPSAGQQQQWPHRWAPTSAPAARAISQVVKTNGHRAFLVDTLALVRKLESQGVPTKLAEAITSAITEVLNDRFESISELFVSKAEMQMSPE